MRKDQRWTRVTVRAEVNDVGIQGDALTVDKPLSDIDGVGSVAFVNCRRCEEGLSVRHETHSGDIRAFAQDHSACTIGEES